MSLTKGFYHDDSTLGPEEDRIAVIRTAFSKGITLLNTADFYGPYDNHKLIGKPSVVNACIERTARPATSAELNLTATFLLRYIMGQL